MKVTQQLAAPVVLWQRYPQPRPVNPWWIGCAAVESSLGGSPLWSDGTGKQFEPMQNRNTDQGVKNRRDTGTPISLLGTCVDSRRNEWYLNPTVSGAGCTGLCGGRTVLSGELVAVGVRSYRKVRREVNQDTRWTLVGRCIKVAPRRGMPPKAEVDGEHHG